MSRSPRRLAVLVAVVAVLVAGCANQDVDGSDAASVLEDAGAPADVQTCVGDRFDDELTQGELNEVGGADTLDELEGELATTVQSILDECVSGESAPDEGDDETEGEGDETEGDDTTETTAEGDEGTTTTSAPG